ncbi:MAG: ATP-binding protein [Actinomycetota bacterium]|nr:ATP-binding protein [Actinomycetota bacterium]
MSVDAVRNPYTPGAGSRPPVLSGRDAQLDAFRILLERLRLGRPEKSLLMTGLRGVGKTVLLGTLDGIAEEAGFRTASAEITHETDFSTLMARLTRRALLSLSPAGRLQARARRAAAVLKAFTLRLPDGVEIGIDVEAAVGRGDSGNLADDLADVLVELGNAAADHHSGVVFLFDEIQFLGRREFEALISSLHQCTQRNLPVTLVGAGLPQLPALAGAAKSYAERMFDFPVIDRLDETAASGALELPAAAEGAGFEPEATRRVIEFTDGYPYFLQEYGKHVWNIAAGPVIAVADVAQAEPIVRLQLDDNFFRVRVARTTAAELAYLSAMADLGDGPYRSGDIAVRLGRSGPEGVAPTRSRLIDKGLIFSPSYGLNEFTVPAFADFLRRNYPHPRRATR